MSTVFRFLVITLAFSFSAYAGDEGNGATRGGGDVYSAEVFSIARGIAKKLRVWSESGILKLTEAQIRKVEAIVDLSPTPDPSTPLLEVYSFDRVYKHPEMLPSRAADETTLINVYAHSPPRIEVGRIRWDSLKGHAVEKEMMVLHELIGAAGLLGNGKRIDDQFQISYELKMKTLEDWENFRDEARTSATILFSLAKLQVNRDKNLFARSAEQIRTQIQYDQIMHPQNYVKGKRKMRMLQKEAWSEVSSWISGSVFSITSSMDVLLEKISSLQCQQYWEWSRASERYPAAWSSWVNNILIQYLATHSAVTERQNQYNGDFAVTLRREDYCGNSAQVPVEQYADCVVDFLSIGLSEDIDSVEKGWEDDLDKAMVTALDDLSTPITPDDLTNL